MSKFNKILKELETEGKKIDKILEELTNEGKKIVDNIIENISSKEEKEEEKGEESKEESNIHDNIKSKLEDLEKKYQFHINLLLADIHEGKVISDKVISNIRTLFHSIEHIKDIKKKQ